MIKYVEPKSNDYAAISQLIEQSFKNAPHRDGNEQLLVGRLRDNAPARRYLELIAKDLDSDMIIGEGMLSEIEVVNESKTTRILCLAPLAISPTFQRQGIGSKLVRKLEAKAKDAGYLAISILGDPAFYGRFGYAPASEFGIQAPMEVADDNFMIQPLTLRGLDEVSGVIQYPAAFGI